MGAVNNCWLGFSLSPNLTVDLQESSHSQSASTVATNSMVHSNVPQPSVGFGRDSCYELLPSSDNVHLPDGSLYILDSINRTQAQEWQTRSMDTGSDLQSQHLINADLSMLVGGRTERMCSNTRYDHRHEQEGPKLEDFLGGASLGGGGGQQHQHYSDSRNESRRASDNLEGMYGAAPSFNDGEQLAMKMIVPDSGRLNCFNAFDIADSELSATNDSKPSEGQTLKPDSVAAVSALHGSNLRESYGQNSNDYVFPDCSLQLPQTTGLNNNNGNNNNNNNANEINGLSMIKTWLRTQPSSAESKMNTSSFGGTSCSTIGTTAATTSDPKEGLNALTNIQSLSLSMSPTSQSTATMAIVPVAPAASQNGILDGSSSDSKKRLLPDKPTTSEPALRKSIDTFGQRTSIYRGVTRHRWTGRYEAHLWDNSCRREGQTRKGRQVYLGGYDKEEKAARAYDLAALKYWGPTTTTNFPISNYEKELEEMKHMTRQEYVASLRRKSSGFSRGASMYRGVTRHHQHGRWQARIGRVAGNKDLYLGTFSTQEEAAEAYDIAAIKFRGLNAVTNFDMSRYDVKSILASSTLPVGGHVKRLKEAEPSDPSVDGRRNDDDSISSYAAVSYNNAASKSHEWPLIAAFQNHANHQSRSWCKQEQGTQAQDFQVQLHHSLHNQKYYQPSMMTPNATVLHNLMSLESPSTVDTNNNSTGSTSALFTNISNNNVAGNGILMASAPAFQAGAVTLASDNQTRTPFGQNEHGNLKAYENMNIYSDPFQRGVYYLPQQPSANVKANYDPNAGAAAGYNNWIAPAPTQALAPRPHTTVCHAPIFSIWNDS